ncbi:MAG: hypothetical protein EZS28_013013 [Streblomastix strix]|uniref:Uncharacterized protein n=1 Tax=Streblomastix strix TaxID=222440 RepID=A0A5J4WAB7_9EUKA|nr:MAG: hypothetical protein EZS28_013013 [Streblomastix strix]
MQSKQKNQKSAIAIISFTDSYAQNKQRKQNEQQESESTLSLAQVTSRLKQLWRQIHDKKSRKQVTQIPKLLQSLIALVTFRLGTHLRKEMDLLRLEVRHQSRQCLWNIHFYGDEYVQSELVIIGYGRVMSISFSTAGGIGDEKDEEISYGLYRISRFLSELHEGRNWQPSFQPLPLLVRMSLEQIEDEGANEELEAQINNKGVNGRIKGWANDAKAVTLNRFIHRGRT